MTRVVIAGAGIAGLTAAIALAEAGLEVMLLDRSALLGEAGAGLQLSPNATRVLGRLGVLGRVSQTAVKLEAVRIRRGRDGADLARLPLGDEAEARFGAPFLVCHRADLHSALLDAALSHPGVTITTGESLESFASDREQVAVTLRSAEGHHRTVSADGLIGADGLGSTVRSTLAGPSDQPVYSGQTAWRAVIPVERVSAACRLWNSNLWLGRKTHLVHYPVRNGSLVNVVAIVEDRWKGGSAPDFWAVPGDPARLRLAFEGWCAEARALIDAAPDWRIWPLFDRPPLPRWSEDGVTLVGDAAHPMLPFLAQGAAQAIEDGWALGQAVRRHRNGLTTAFAAYEAARRPKADRVQRVSRLQGALYHLGPPASLVRDIGMRALGPDRMLARYDWLYGAGPAS